MKNKQSIKNMINREKILTIGITIIFITMMITIGCIGQKNNQKKEGNMKLSSPAFENEGVIPAEYTCDGKNISPPLIISDVPENAKSLALIMDDPDAPFGTFVHWLIWNIPPNTTNIPEGGNISYPQGKNDFRKQGYGGPCPPFGTHRYFFKLYALDTLLDLEEGAKKKDLLKAMSGHIIEETQLIGVYSR